MMSQDSCDHEKAVFMQTDEDGNEVERCIICSEDKSLTLDNDN